MSKFMIIALALVAYAAAKPEYGIYSGEFVGGLGFGGAGNSAIGVGHGFSGSSGVNEFARSASFGRGLDATGGIHSMHVGHHILPGVEHAHFDDVGFAHGHLGAGLAHEHHAGFASSHGHLPEIEIGHGYHPGIDAIHTQHIEIENGHNHHDGLHGGHDLHIEHGNFQSGLVDHGKSHGLHVEHSLSHGHRANVARGVEHKHHGYY